jgi:hypothetical protein
MVDFVGVFFLIVAASNLLVGIVALANAGYYGDVKSKLLLFNLTAWGIVWCAVGFVQLLVGYWILIRRPFSLSVGVFFAALNLVAQLTFVHIDPAWSIAIMVLDAIVIWALFANRDEFA